MTDTFASEAPPTAILPVLSIATLCLDEPCPSNIAIELSVITVLAFPSLPRTSSSEASATLMLLFSFKVTPLESIITESFVLLPFNVIVPPNIVISEPKVALVVAPSIIFSPSVSIIACSFAMSPMVTAPAGDAINLEELIVSLPSEPLMN